MRLIKTTFAVCIFVAVASFVLVTNPSTVNALSGDEFQAGRIIDDSIFYDSDAMTAEEIQQFLNAKVPVCDTNGEQPYAGTTAASYGTSRGYPPPYICLKDYVQTSLNKPAETGLCDTYTGSSQTAAQIIKGVADACGINPQVLIVLLQKEQSLVTDDWPWPIQYLHATGYGCPDGAACAPEFEGLFNQLYYAARQFKRYALTPQNFNYRAGMSNYILYNPNPACDGSDVFIENQATASLYNYTPYQPNAAALNNLYGTGDGCSAYGNRNFWRYFNDWFGSTLEQEPTPTAGITVNGLSAATIAYRGNVTVAWSSENADSCVVNQGMMQAMFSGISGQSQLTNVTASMTFELVCTSASGNTTQQATLTVLPPTFSQIRGDFAVLQSLYTAKGNNLKDLLKQLDTAEKSFERGDKVRASKSLQQIKVELNKLQNSGKLPAQQTQWTIQMIDDLLQSWN